MREWKCRTIDEIQVGDSAESVRTIGFEDILAFAGVSHDLNPVHVDPAFAEQTMFKGPIAHGMFTASLVSALLANELPGVGTIYLAQTLRFRAPVRPGDTLRARVEVKEVHREKAKVVLETTVTNQEGTLVLDGQATVLAPKEKPVRKPGG